MSDDQFHRDTNAMILMLWISLVLGFVALTLIYRQFDGCWFWER